MLIHLHIVEIGWESTFIGAFHGAIEQHKRQRRITDPKVHDPMEKRTISRLHNFQRFQIDGSSYGD
jgi:hypothetical protein